MNSIKWDINLIIIVLCVGFGVCVIVACFAAYLPIGCTHKRHQIHQINNRETSANSITLDHSHNRYGNITIHRSNNQNNFNYSYNNYNNNQFNNGNNYNYNYESSVSDSSTEI